MNMMHSRVFQGQCLAIVFTMFSLSSSIYLTIGDPSFIGAVQTNCPADDGQPSWHISRLPLWMPWPSENRRLEAIDLVVRCFQVQPTCASAFCFASKLSILMIHSIYSKFSAIRENLDYYCTAVTYPNLIACSNSDFLASS